MAVDPRSPLDMDQWLEEQPTKSSLFNKAYLLELIPLLIIWLAIGLRYFDLPFWKEILFLGGSSAAIVYLLFAWYILEVRSFTSIEFVFSVFCGLLFPFGIISIYLQWKGWVYAADLIAATLRACVFILAASFLLILFNLADARKSGFYRNLIGRILILTTILLRIYF